MALVTCPDCGKSVSDAAISCIECGRPMRAAEPESTIRVAESPVLIEQSAKKYKRGMLVGLAAIPAALLLLLIGANGISPGVEQTFATLAFIVALAGALWFIYNLIARWWHHG